MSVRTELIAHLRRYDEDAFVALANRGLLRRAGKDLEAAQPSIAEESGAALVIASGEQRIRFDARGPAQASCSCPTAGVCQHILAAALWLQRQDATPNDALSSVANTAGAEADPTPGADAASESFEQLQAALLRFSAAELSKHAGKPGYRWAWQFVLDLDAERGLRIGGDRNVVIGFQQPRMTFRYMGGGLENLIADTAVGKIEKYRVAAVLAFQRAHGIEMVAPGVTARAGAAALDLGKDHELAEPADAARHASRARLRDAIRQLLCECLTLGLSHLSQGIQERFSTLAVWAQGAEYYRLALLLRRLADHVELLLERAGGADEHRLFEEATIAFALTQALDASEARGETPAHLLGRARNAYESTHALELLGLGAMPWRTASGYIGLTMLFWSPADQCFLSCSDARPEAQRAGFNPVARYRIPGPWSGLGAPAQATGRRLQLREAQINALGRLSATERTQATLQPVNPDEFVKGLNPCNDWSALQASRAQARRSLLSEPQPMHDWAVLKPARFGDARFDVARQTLLWPLFDATDCRLEAEIPYSEFNQPAIDRIEALAAEPLPANVLLVARIRNAASELVAEPLSLIRPDVAPGMPAIDSLYFDQAPQHGLLAKAMGKLRQLASRTASAQTDEPDPGLPTVLDEFRAWLMRQAERGVAETLALQTSAAFDAHVERLRNAGLSGFSSRPPGQEMAASLFRAHYVLMQYGKLLGAKLETDGF